VTRLVAFLGGINVGGHRVTMDRLRAEVSSLGYTDVATYIASGNVVFSAAAGRDHERLLEAHLAERFGWPVPSFVRTAAEVRGIAAADPFGGTPDGFTHMVALCRTDADAERVDALGDGRNRFVVDGREVHWLIEGGMSTSGITSPKLLRAFGQATLRNIKTMRGLVAAPCFSPTAT
jgi:uncharacterized protein (DUF1697 family)